MDNKEKKQLNLFKSVQISKENKEKYFKVQRSDFKSNSINNAFNKNSVNNQDQSNHLFITHKDNINSNISSKKGINQNNNINGKFVTTNDETKYNKNSLINNNGINIINELHIIDENVYNSKLNLVYFESVKKLCNHLNQNFNQLTQDDEIVDINEYLTQMYQNLQILNRKLELITNKQTFNINKEDYEILNILLNHLFYMNKILNNNISKNILNIYFNLKNFFGKCNCSI